MDKSDTKISRRKFFTHLSVGWMAFSAACGTTLAMIFRFSFPNVSYDPESKVVIGLLEEIKPGVEERWKKNHSLWIVREKDQIYALSTVCTHLGCIPKWFNQDKKFKCPCHGSGFKMNGVNFEGPAPRPLERYAISINRQGIVIVDKSKKYRKELGQWEDSASFLVI